MKIRKEQRKDVKAKPSPENLGFGNMFTDHMFVMDYSEEKGWYDPRIVPYGPFEIEPSAMVFHYGQEMFEGLKAYRNVDGEVNLFRPEKNIERTNRTNDRICMPRVDEAFMLEAIKELVRVEKDWVPSLHGTSLYIRPFIIATDPFLGVRPSLTYKLMIILSPVGAYYKEGINPVKIYVEDKYVRAVKGGLGFAKTGANYVASLKAQIEAKQKGFSQVLWLDAKEQKYVEEVGTMNVMFVIDGKVITPKLGGSILPGITRDSCITLLKDFGIEVEERDITIEEVIHALQAGRLDEAFGTGTAAVISPIGLLSYKGEEYIVNDEKIGNIAKKLYDTITKIQYGEIEDKFGWIHRI